jgi:hypothetical protein
VDKQLDEMRCGYKNIIADGTLFRVPSVIPKILVKVRNRSGSLSHALHP